MPATNTEIVRGLFEARAQGNIERVIEIFHPEAEVHPIAHEDQVYHRRDGVRRYFRDLASRGEQVEVASYQFLEKDDYVVALGSVRQRAAEHRMDSSAAWVMKIRDGKVLESLGYRVSADALAAVGMRLG